MNTKDIGDTNADLKTEQGSETLRKINIGNRTHGFIEGPLGYIVCDIDFCYGVRSLRENIELAANYSWEKPRDLRVLAIEDLRAIAEPITSYREWAHHWGINPRIRRNYQNMAQHAHELGANVALMPEWGEEPEVNESAKRPISDCGTNGQASETN